jgi:hypothetical protein
MMSPIARALAVAALTCAAALPLLVPRSLFADDKDALATFLLPGGATAVGEVIGEAEVRRDARAKSGWGVHVAISNPDDTPHTASVAVTVQRSFFNPVGRTSSVLADVWVSVIHVEVPAHATVTKDLTLPASIGAEMDQSAVYALSKQIAVKRAQDRGESPPAWADGIEGAPRRSWSVALRVPST